VFGLKKKGKIIGKESSQNVVLFLTGLIVPKVDSLPVKNRAINK